ncbi:MAG TPA: HDOD domain-containing protein [Myxococcota bacterium]
MSRASDVVSSAVGSLDRLPVAPTIFAELQKTLDDKRAGLGDVARVLERDPALLAKTIRLASSAFFGSARISSCEQAAARLGLRALQTLALTISIFDTVDKKGLPASINVDAEQAHAVVVGANARAIDPDDGDAFMAAMLCDVGRLALAVAAPDVFTKVHGTPRRTGESAHEVEQRMLGTTHAEIGAFLLGSWGLPPSVVEAVRAHHRPELASTPHRRLVAVVHVASSAADEHAPNFAALAKIGAHDDAIRWHASL